MKASSYQAASVLIISLTVFALTAMMGLITEELSLNQRVISTEQILIGNSILEFRNKIHRWPTISEIGGFRKQEL